MPRYVVRVGSMRTLGVFSAGRGLELRRSDRVIARTDRGLEDGEVLCEATPDVVKRMGEHRRGQVLRHVTPEDENELRRLGGAQDDAFEIFRRHTRELDLEMQLVDVERVFGGERIVFYYLAENRVDFRELVKLLAREFQTRIEMRQIGVRDEAKLLADYGDCGKPVCCNTHLSAMPPVSMKMAKLQKMTLDPSKISGRCGRLKCCLRYEYDTYVDMQAELPRVGSDVVTQRGRARVLGQDVLTSQLLVQTEDHRRVMIPASEVLTVLDKGRGKNVAKTARRVRTTPRTSMSRAVPSRNSPNRIVASGTATCRCRPSHNWPSQNRPSLNRPSLNWLSLSDPSRSTAGRSTASCSGLGRTAQRLRRSRLPRMHRPTIRRTSNCRTTPPRARNREIENREIENRETKVPEVAAVADAAGVLNGAESST
ncbi:MAG: regulatory iron-sulfur-containing complex subunit RicT [Pirellulales bacterium]